VSDSHLTFQSEELTADFCLGEAIAGVNTLIGIALIIAFASSSKPTGLCDDVARL
jgi:hypothetical protein